jgi:hypothetical protein
VDRLTKQQQETVGCCAFEIFLVCGGPMRMEEAGMGIKIKDKVGTLPMNVSTKP